MDVHLYLIIMHIVSYTSVNDARLINEWERFVKFGIKPRGIDRNIASSWARSKDLGINPYKCVQRAEINEKELHKRISLKESNLKIISPYLEKIHRAIRGEGYLLYYADELGNVLHIVADDADRSFFEKQFYFRKGTSCKEEITGTTAASLVLTDRIIVSHMSSHKYCLQLKNTTCSALPLSGDNNEFIGIIGAALNFKTTNKHIVGSLLSAKMGIENQFRLLKQNNELRVLNNYYSNYLGMTSDATIFVDYTGNIVNINKKASDIINEKPSRIIGKKVTDVLNFPAVLFNDSANDFSDSSSFIDTRDKKTGYSFSKLSTYFRCSTESNEDINIFIKENNTGNFLKPVKKTEAEYTFKDLIGNSKLFSDLIELAKKASESNSNVLITGESGTGKELLAHSIHNESYRSGKPFVIVNCGAIPRELAESEFFGYEGGAFTGADKKGRKGFFEKANGGTIFLDEIGEMPKALQTKILRVIQNKKITRIGGNKEISTDVRVIAATNKNIEEEVTAGNFRSDLYFRLNVIRLHIPNLLQRKSDILLLARHFINKHIQPGQRKITLGKPVISILKEYNWPGNIRELENVIEQALVFIGDETEIGEKHLPESLKQIQKNTRVVRSGSLYEDEMRKVQKALKKADNNISLAARILGISRNTLYKKIKDFGIDCSKF